MIDWFDLLAVLGTLKSLLEHHSSKVSILRCSAFFNSPTLTSIHDYWKNHSLDETDLCWQSNAEEAEQFYEDLQDLLEKKKSETLDTPS